MNYPNKYQQKRKIEIKAIESVNTFVRTKKNAKIEFRTTSELKKYLMDNYNGKMSAYIESLIYADLNKQGVDLYKTELIKEHYSSIDEIPFELKRVK